MEPKYNTKSLVFENRDALPGSACCWMELPENNAEGSMQERRVLKVLELYAGVGGMVAAAEMCSESSGGEVGFEVVGVYEISPEAIAVYRANHGKDAPVKQVSIESVSVEQFDKIGADVWMASPPCQPYTRQGLQKDLEDPRSASLAHLISVLPRMKNPPSFVLIENVVNFEGSQSREALVGTLRDLGYVMREYLLSPLQFGLPNSRKRYYGLARRLGAVGPFPGSSESSQSGILTELAPWTMGPGGEGEVRQLLEFLDPELVPECWRGGDDETLPAASEPWMVEAGLFEKPRAMQFDVVTPFGRSSNCFTGNYGRYLVGTGSVLQLNPAPLDSIVEAENPKSMAGLRLRYFTPREVAAIHRFPSEFVLPSTTSRKVGWKLLGNSLNVEVVARLLSLLVGT